ncbi:MAG: purine-nucleoside phosphorylase [Thermoanaerobaculia bacterium]|nr:purine-nucleoside phosphorylase [Thermoanaerobaculia bacterium]
MEHYAAELDLEVARWDSRGWPRPEVALVAGSGLGVELGPALASRPLGDLLPFPVRAVAGHDLAVELLELSGRRVLYFRGRLHAYQGYEAGQVVFPVRLAARLGARVLVITNAAGGVDPALAAGDLALITDQLNLTGRTPLWGDPPTAWGPRFPDLADAYAPALRRLARREAERLGIPLAEGVYAGLTGPAYETPAEVRMLRTLGAGLVGMSTVLEVIAARHLGLACLGLSLVSNPAAGVTDAPLCHEDVLAAAREATGRLRRLLGALLTAPELLPAGS